MAAVGLLVPILLFGALSSLTRTLGSSGPIPVTDAGLLGGLGLELLLTATLGLWLWRSGWRPHRSATQAFGWQDPARGMVLWAGAIAAVFSWALVCRIAFPNIFTVATQTRITGAPHVWVSLPFSIFNAMFEELLWLGLGVSAFRRLGAGRAGAVSIALRVLAHAYQGPLALITVLPVGTLFTVYYIRTRRLWPVVVAHAFQDTLALGLLASRSGPI